MTNPAMPGIRPSLFLFALLYGGMVCIAGVLGNKQVDLGPLAVEAGIFSFLQLVILSSATAELHGRAAANRMVLWGFVPLVMSILLFLLVLALPAAQEMDPARRDGFQLVLGQSPRLMAAGIIAYGVSQILNVTIFSALRGREGEGRLLWLRAGVASIASQIVDTFLFVTIAFLGVFPIGELMLGQMIAKVMLSIVLVPPLIYLCVGLGRRLDARG
ncbi:MAG: queuosine precursor transporter [Sphingomonadaceae bacterium]